MVMRILGFAVLVLASLMALPGHAAAKVRLVYGESWSEAGRKVKATLSSSAFKNAAKGKYVVELVDEEGPKQSPENLGTYKLPAIFLISEANNCFFVFENVPYDVTAKYLIRYFDKANAIRLEYEKNGFATVDDCGEFLFKIEHYVGGPRRVIAKGFYADVYDKLQKLDPEDKVGWVRHFTMPFTDHTGKSCSCKNSDGYEIVEEATWYRVNNRMSEGEEFIRKMHKKFPARHLTREQRQGLAMAKFALYREDPAHRQEMIKLLNDVLATNEETLWGTAALGYLNILGVPPLSTYWGWHSGDFKGPQLNVTVKYGVRHSFKVAGTYAIRFCRSDNSADAPRITSVSLFAGDEEVALLKDPKVEDKVTTFEYKLPRSLRGALTTMVVKGTAGADGNSSGNIEIKRIFLRPRKDGK